MDDLRKCWKVPYIVYFCNLFEQKLDLIDLRVDEFEEAIIDDCGQERNIIIIHLIQKLLKPFLNRSVDLTNYEQFLLQVLKRNQLEHLFLQEKETNQWSELSMLSKLDIIYSLCEIRLQLSDTETKLTEFEANELRIEPLGIDSRGNKLWYFGDLRLYEEKQQTKQKIINHLELTTGVQLQTTNSKSKTKTTNSITSSSKKKPNTKQINKKSAKVNKKSEAKKKKKKKGDSSEDEDVSDDDEDEEELEDELEEDVVDNELNEYENELDLEDESLNEDNEDKEETENQQIDVEDNQDEEAEEEETNKRRSRKSLNNTKTTTPKPKQTIQTTPSVSTRTTRRSVAQMPKEEVDQLLKPVTPLPTRISTRRSRRLTEQQNVPIEEEITVKKEEEPVEVEKTKELEEPIKKEQELVEPVLETKEEPIIETNKEQIIETKEEEKQVKLEVDESESKDDKRDDIDMAAYIEMIKQPREIKQPERLIEEKAVYKEELKYWSCVCLNLEDWQTVHDKYAASKKKLDQDIAKLIGTNYLPEMPALFQKAEKERWHRLMAMAPKRQSLRLQSKQNEQSTKRDETQPNHFQSESSNESHLLNENSNNSIQNQINKAELMAKQREERLKHRLFKREFGDLVTSTDDASNSQHELNSSKENNDFNLKNYSLMNKVIVKLLQCKYAWPFKNAVSEEDAPDYNNIIQKPMDLSTVQVKVNNKTYKSRQEFLDDLELIVKNCLQYNGDDTYYGKLALKFQNFYKRWLQIFYPREISTSLEEKNRQLMSLMNGGTGVLFHDLTNDNLNETITQHSSSVGGGSNLNEINLTHNANNENEPELLDSMKHHKKKRHHNPDRDKYIQEPQYVTKRTSSGRLVKMKISTDYDYTSDQEQEAKKKKRESDEQDECEGIQQKHRVPGANDLSLESSLASSRSSSISTNDDRSDDEDFIGSKSISNRKQTPGIRSRGPGRGSGQRGRPPRRTVKALTESINAVKFKAFNEYEDDSDSDVANSVLRRPNHQMSDDDTSSEDEDSDSDNDLRKLNLKKLNSSTNLFRRLTNISDSDSPPSLSVPNPNETNKSQLTFEQYVKKLTGSYTLNSSNVSSTSQPINGITISPNKATTPALVQQQQQQPTSRISLKITPAPSIAKTLANQTNTPQTTTTTNVSKLPLTIPIINPAIKAVLTKFNQQTKPVNVNSNNTPSELTSSSVASSSCSSSASSVSPSTLQKTVKLITVPSQVPQPNSKFIILNSTTNEQTNSNTNLSNSSSSSTTTTNSTAIKVINLAQINNGINLKQIATPTLIKTNGTTTTTTTSSNNNILSPILNKQIFMINNSNTINTNKQIVVNTVHLTQPNNLTTMISTAKTTANTNATSTNDTVKSTN